MIPIALDPRRTPLAVIGRGTPALRRFRALRLAGAQAALLFCDRPAPELAAEFGKALRPALPGRAEFAALRVAWITGLPRDLAARLATLARGQGVLVNVEDDPPLCDFHSVAEVRRGDLLLTVSTAGQSPTLAARIRARLSGQFGPEWAARTRWLGELRRGWRGEGRGFAELASLSGHVIDQEGWLE